MRRPHIDWARALAVLVMIEAHTLDAWTSIDDRSSEAFRNLTVLGGFAAPLFLWLAGLVLILTAEASFVRTGDRRTTALTGIRRGLEIFVLAFLFRVQALVVTPGSPLITLFRVDILNVMGPSLAAAALVWWVAGHRSVAVGSFVALAAAIAMATPLVRTAGWIDVLPLWIQWHLRPAGEHTAFTAFPWAGFVFAGAALGILMPKAFESRRELALHVGVGAFGMLLVAMGFEASRRTTIYEQSFFWTSSPTFFVIRVGVLMLFLAVLYALERLARLFDVRLGPLENLGRNSLFIYWIHVELVYGYATWFLRHRLELWQTLIAYSVFCALMYGALLARDAFVERWKMRSTARTPSMIRG